MLSFQTEKGKRKPRWFSLIHLLFAHCAKQKFVVRLFVYEENKQKLSVCKWTKRTKRTCPSRVFKQLQLYLKTKFWKNMVPKMHCTGFKPYLHHSAGFKSKSIIDRIKLCLHKCTGFKCYLKYCSGFRPYLHHCTGLKIFLHHCTGFKPYLHNCTGLKS